MSRLNGIRVKQPRNKKLAETRCSIIQKNPARNAYDYITQREGAPFCRVCRLSTTITIINRLIKLCRRAGEPFNSFRTTSKQRLWSREEQNREEEKKQKQKFRMAAYLIEYKLENNLSWSFWPITGAQKQLGSRCIQGVTKSWCQI